MTLHFEWMRFQRTCLKGKGSAEITSIKGVYFCGAAAATDLMLAILEGDLSPDKKRWAIGKITTELKDFQRYTAKKAAEEAQNKK